jgi:HPt (histidine-containing phosphotransfer) domain-containing protein
MSVLDPETVDQLRALAREANPDLLHRLQASFARDTPPRLVAMRAAISSGDADALAFGLHTLSGSAANLGAIEIVATCRLIESASEAAGAPGLEQLLDQLERNAAEAGAELARVAADG